MRSPLSLLFPRFQFQLTQPCLRGQMLLSQFCASSLDSLQYVHVSLALGSPELGPVLHVCPHQCWGEGITSLDLLVTLLLMQSRIAAFAARAHCWFMFNLVSTPRSFSIKLLSSWVTPSIYCAWGWSSPGAGLFTSPGWTSAGSCRPISLACWGPAGRQQDPLV